MARVLIVGGGCRGLTLARGLVAEGHAVRICTRSEDGRAAIEDAGAECFIGDPDRMGTLRAALDRVVILTIALGNATDPDPERVAALHTDRLDMLLSNVLDTTVHGIVYEAAGGVPAEVLAEGARRVAGSATKSRIPHAVITTDPADAPAWVAAHRAAIGELLGIDPSG